VTEDVVSSWSWVDDAALSPVEEQVLRTVFWNLLGGRRVEPEGIVAAGWLTPDIVESALASLEAQRCLRRSPEDGTIVAARGLMTRPSRHRLTTDEGTVFTQCAVDAIAIPAALGIAGHIEDSCPTCDCSITVTVGARQELTVRPVTAVVVMAQATDAGNCCDEAGIPTMCNETNLFCCPDHATSWQQRAGTLESALVTPLEALDGGRELWVRFARGGARQSAGTT
jgi:hypothetical protein